MKIIWSSGMYPVDPDRFDDPEVRRLCADGEWFDEDVVIDWDAPSDPPS